MSEDTDPSDDTNLFPQRKLFADEAFVIREAVSRFAPSELSQKRGVVAGPGDDAGVFDCGGPELVVVSCDSMVEGVHFKPEWLSPGGDMGGESVGAKAVLCAASDIAAMGAVPQTVVVSAGLPANTSQATVKTLLDGIARGCESVGAVVIGGNTTSSPAVFIDVTVTGGTVGRNFVLRSGARRGDEIFVTGSIGGAQAGLELFENLPEKDDKGDVSSGLFRDRAYEALKKFRLPEPKISVGLALCGIATAMTDVSDGLLMDLGCISAASGVGAEVFIDRIPVFDSSLCGRRSALTAGGDYELLFTAPRTRLPDIKEVSKKTGVKITRIGEVTGGDSVRIFGQNGEVPASEFGAGGFMHNGKT